MLDGPMTNVRTPESGESRKENHEENHAYAGATTGRVRKPVERLKPDFPPRNRSSKQGDKTTGVLRSRKTANKRRKKKPSAAAKAAAVEQLSRVEKQSSQQFGVFSSAQIRQYFQDMAWQQGQYLVYKTPEGFAHYGKKTLDKYVNQFKVLSEAAKNRPGFTDAYKEELSNFSDRIEYLKHAIYVAENLVRVIPERRISMANIEKDIEAYNQVKENLQAFIDKPVPTCLLPEYIKSPEFEAFLLLCKLQVEAAILILKGRGVDAIYDLCAKTIDHTCNADSIYKNAKAMSGGVSSDTFFQMAKEYAALVSAYSFEVDKNVSNDFDNGLRSELTALGRAYQITYQNYMEADYVLFKKELAVECSFHTDKVGAASEHSAAEASKTELLIPMQENRSDTVAQDAFMRSIINAEAFDPEGHLKKAPPVSATTPTPTPK